METQKRRREWREMEHWWKHPILIHLSRPYPKDLVEKLLKSVSLRWSLLNFLVTLLLSLWWSVASDHSAEAVWGKGRGRDTTLKLAKLWRGGATSLELQKKRWNVSSKSRKLNTIGTIAVEVVNECSEYFWSAVASGHFSKCPTQFRGW